MKVIVLDDHYLVREGTRRLLESTDEVDVVATLGDATEVEDAVSRLGPDAIVTDIRMPPGHRMEGIDAAHRIRATYPSVGVVVLSQHANAMYAFELFRHGTAGLAYLLKDRIGEVDELLRALRAVVTGGSVIDPAVVEGLLGHERARAHRPIETLTDRETDVLRLMAEGHANSAIAEALHLSQSAVEKHINAIFTKLNLPADEAGTHRRVAAVLAYLQCGATPGST